MGDNAGLDRLLSILQGLQMWMYSLSPPKTICAWWRAAPYEMRPCLCRRLWISRNKTSKTIPNLTEWAPFLQNEWQWVSLSWMMRCGIPGDLPDVLSLTRHGASSW
jgi:hypothetical protein